MNETKQEQLTQPLNNEQVDQPKKSADMSLKKVFTIVNVCSLLFTLLQIFTKDLLINRGVTVFEFVFFRSVFNMISSAMLVKLTFKE